MFGLFLYLKQNFLKVSVYAIKNRGPLMVNLT